MDAVLATLDLATLQTYRAEALAALHALNTGRKTVNLGFEGRQRSFNRVDIAELRRWINEIQAAIDAKSGATQPVPRPIYPGFGFR